MTGISFIDLSADFSTLHGLRGTDYDAAVAKLIEKHGGGCNEHGVFFDTEVVVIAESGRAHAAVRLARAPDGLWFAGYDYRYATGEGGGGPASVCSPRAYACREDALQATIEEWFVGKFRNLLADKRSAYSDIAKTSARQMLDMIETVVDPVQPDLFA